MLKYIYIKKHPQSKNKKQNKKKESLNIYGPKFQGSVTL